MKRILIFAVVLSLLVPAAAFAATEFSLGGYIKLDSYWESAADSKNIGGIVARDNDPSFHHGNLRFTAQGSRFNFTIKGPDVLGAKLTGFIEMDFDSCTDVGSIQNGGPGVVSASNNYIPRLRHAMFRLNWPGDTELLFGQYWSMFCDWYAESAQDAPFQAEGSPTARIPQIRFTQGFLGDWHVAGLVGEPNNSAGIFAGTPYSTTLDNGNSAETPQIQGQIKYAHDWWGKAAYYGHPIPFTASVTAGWQRNVARPSFGNTLADLNLQGIPGVEWAHTYVSPWMVQGALFIPIIPTHTEDLTGTAHLIVTPWIGQGVNAFGMTGDETNVFKLSQLLPGGVKAVDPELLHRFGLMGEAQYYFTNQWFVNAAYAITGGFDVNRGFTYMYNAATEQFRDQQEVDATLWYQPIKALKFGLQYSFVRSKFLCNTYPNGGLPGTGTATSNGGLSLSDTGTEHRVEFVGFFFF